MKKFKLRKWVKVVLFIIIFTTITLVVVNLSNSRIKKIENGSIILVDQNGADR